MTSDRMSVLLDALFVALLPLALLANVSRCWPVVLVALVVGLVCVVRGLRED
jgi:hypothetical protein